MTIEYCSTCRERIDAADFRSGAAIQFKGQSYCASCKDEVLEEIEDDPEYIAQERKRQREGARKSDRLEGIGSGIRPGLGRAVRREPAAARGGSGGGPNMMMIGGIAAGVLVLGLGAWFALSGDDKPRKPAKKPGRGTNTARENSGKGKRPKKPADDGFSEGPSKPSDPGDTGGASKPSMEQIMEVRAALNSLREKRESVQKFAEDNGQPEQWRNVDLQWKNLLEDETWDKASVRDDAQVKELRAQVEKDRQMARGRFETEGNDVISRAIQRAQGFAMRKLFSQAMGALESVPPIYSDLPKYQEIKDNRAKIEEMAKKHMGTVGEWFDVITKSSDSGKLLLPNSAAGRESKVIGDAGDESVVIKVGAQPITAIFSPRESEIWADYEIEIEAKAPAKCQLAMRVTANPETGRLQGSAWTFDADTADAYHKYLIKVEGQKLIAFVDGEKKGEGASHFRRGKPMLILQPDCEFRIRSLRYKVNKLYQR